MHKNICKTKHGEEEDECMCYGGGDRNLCVLHRHDLQRLILGWPNMRIALVLLVVDSRWPQIFLSLPVGRWHLIPFSLLDYWLALVTALTKTMWQKLSDLILKKLAASTFCVWKHSLWNSWATMRGWNGLGLSCERPVTPWVGSLLESPGQVQPSICPHQNTRYMREVVLNFMTR